MLVQAGGGGAAAANRRIAASSVAPIFPISALPASLRYSVLTAQGITELGINDLARQRHGTSPGRAGRVFVPPPTHGTIAVQCFPSLLVNPGRPNGSGPPWHPPPPPMEPAAAENASSATIKPVQSQAPLAIAHVFRNCRRLGRCSPERRTSATISEMKGMAKPSRIATRVISAPYGVSSPGGAAAPRLMVAEIDPANAGSAA